jgi:hypothetical protein
MQERLNYALELQTLRNRVAALEKQLKEDAERDAESPRMFEVTLKVTTLPSTWGEEYVDCDTLEQHLFDYMFEVKEALHLDDGGDEIKVLKVTEVT